MDKRADAKGEEGDRKNGGGGLGIDGEGSLGRAGEGGGKLEKGAGSAEESKQGHQQGGMHHVFAQILLLAKQPEDQ